MHAEWLARLRRRWPRWTELSLFCLVGFACLIVDYAIFVPLVHWQVLDPRLAALAGYIVSVTVSYALNRRLTFPDAVVSSLVLSYALFVAVGGVGAAVRIGVMQGFMWAFGWTGPPEVYVSSLFGIVVGTVVTFLGSRFLAFPAGPGRT
jgi:putative flippase GtrA